MNEAILASEIRPYLESHRGNEILKATLQATSSEKELFTILSTYVYFNSFFGGGVANLAGEIAIRQDLFQDGDESIKCLKDRSDQIAARVFAAAIDEFADWGKSSTHRAFAQATIKGAAEYMGLTADEINSSLDHNLKFAEIVDRVKNGYLLNQKVTDENLFRAIGFHMGSEVLADEEFNIIDNYLTEFHPKMVRYLQKADVKIGGSAYPGYYWIKVHTSVEADHFSYAVKAANSGLKYYSGNQDKSVIKNHIISGLESFAQLQTDFMNRLSE